MTNEALIPFHAVIACRPEVKDLELGETLRFKKGGGELELMEWRHPDIGDGFRLVIDGKLCGSYFTPAQFFKFIFPQKQTP